MKVIIAAAGTGGHINPGIAIANKIMQEAPGSEVIFIGTTRGLENDLVPKSGFKLKTINAYGIPRKISVENIHRFISTVKSVKEAEDIIDQFRPDVVIGTGGYITLAVGKAAIKRKIPLIMHESNAFPGMSIKLLEKKASKVLVGFEDTKLRLRNKENVVVTGTPTNVKERTIPDEEKMAIKLSLGMKPDMPLVLVFGGSQGAKSINEAFANIVSKKENKEYQIYWAAGRDQYDEVKNYLKHHKLDIENVKNAKILPYIYNMNDVMNACDLVVCRSGAMTITEVSILGKPAIFIPYPYATENHQEYNARVLESRGAAKIILDKDLNGNILNRNIMSIITSKEKLNEMSKIAKDTAIKNVEDKIYEQIKNVIK